MPTAETPDGRAPSASAQVRAFVDMYTKGLTTEEFQRLFTRDTREAYRYFSRGIDRDALGHLPWYKRPFVFLRGFFLAFTLKMSPARRALFAGALVLAVIGLFQLAEGLRTEWIPVDPFFVRFPLLIPDWPAGTWLVILAILALNLIVLLEVFERLSLKNDLEIARDIQKAMLPRGLYADRGVEAFGLTRPANTVGGDFYDILPLPDGRLLIAVGDVAGKGSPAALLMALLLAMLRTLVDEGLEPAPLVARLNVQIGRHAPASRFITLLLAIVDPATGSLVSVNAGHLPGLVQRRNGQVDLLSDGGIALGMFEHSTYTAQRAVLEPGDMLVLYSDGITEAEDPRGIPFDEAGLRSLVSAHASSPLPDVGQAIFSAVQRHARDVRFADDLTVLLMRRAMVAPPVSGSPDTAVEPPIPPVGGQSV